MDLARLVVLSGALGLLSTVLLGRMVLVKGMLLGAMVDAMAQMLVLVAPVALETLTLQDARVVLLDAKGLLSSVWLALVVVRTVPLLDVRVLPLLKLMVAVVLRAAVLLGGLGPLPADLAAPAVVEAVVVRDALVRTLAGLPVHFALGTVTLPCAPVLSSWVLSTPVVLAADAVQDARVKLPMALPEMKTANPSLTPLLLLAVLPARVVQQTVMRPDALLLFPGVRAARAEQEVVLMMDARVLRPAVRHVRAGL